MTILVASSNPVKINAVKTALSYWPSLEFVLESEVVDSNVPDQPVGEEQTLAGAKTRVRGALGTHAESAIGVGIEAGIGQLDGVWYAFAWIVVATRMQLVSARSASFPIPSPAIKWLEMGYELGDAIDRAYNLTNSKQQDGAIGVVTGGLITRTDLYVQPLVICFARLFADFPEITR